MCSSIWLYGHQGSLLFAVDLPVAGKPEQVTWKTTITGTPGSQIAADGRLFVTTAEGRLLCFSAEKGPGDVSESVADAKPATSPRATSILKTAGSDSGFGLVLEIGRASCRDRV